MIDEKQIENLCDLCDTTEEELDTLKDQVKKIIDFKKKMANGEVDKNSTMLKKADDVLAVIENLEKIDAKLPEATQKIKELCKKVHLLLGPHINLEQKSSDVSLDLGKK